MFPEQTLNASELKIFHKNTPPLYIKNFFIFYLSKHFLEGGRGPPALSSKSIVVSNLLKILNLFCGVVFYRAWLLVKGKYPEPPRPQCATRLDSFLTNVS